MVWVLIILERNSNFDSATRVNGLGFVKKKPEVLVTLSESLLETQRHHIQWPSNTDQELMYWTSLASLAANLSIRPPLVVVFVANFFYRSSWISQFLGSYLFMVIICIYPISLSAVNSALMEWLSSISWRTIHDMTRVVCSLLCASVRCLVRFSSTSLQSSLRFRIF